MRLSFVIASGKRKRLVVLIISARKADKNEAYYDFSTMEGKKILISKYLKQSVTIRLDCDSVEYFKPLSEETRVPYQTLINLYLRD